MLLDAGGSVNCDANFDSWITDGVRLNWGVTPSSGFMVTVILFAGSDVSANVGEEDNDPGEVDVTDPGFEPKLVFCASHHSDWTDAASSHAQMSLGWCYNPGTGDANVVQGSLNWGSKDNNNLSAPYARIENASSNTFIFGGSFIGGWDLNSFDASGFSISQVGGGGASGVYLALDFSQDAHVEWVDSPTSTGVESYEGPGFTPQFGAFLVSHLTTFASNNTADEAGSFAVSQYSAAAEICYSLENDDFESPAITSSKFSSTAIYANDDTGASRYDAALSAFDSLGSDLTYNQTDTGTARKFLGVWIEEEAASPAAPTLDQWEPQAEAPQEPAPVPVPY